MDLEFPLIRKYFPGVQQPIFDKLAKARETWHTLNTGVNVISRKDMEFLEERHILHSLAIAKLFSFPQGTRFIDVGTGGGFPGIPLAILMPECEFVLLDSIGKKIKVVKAVIESCELENVKAFTERSENYVDQADFVISRAVTQMSPFIQQTSHLVQKSKGRNIPEMSPSRGILYLKGGNPAAELGEELKENGRPFSLFPLKDLFTEPFFETKFLVHIPLP